ncbi:MAG: hypothetical protein RR334_02005, partial [Clostridia bacterium]
MGNFAILLNNAFTSVASNATSFANNSLMGVESFIDTGKTVFEDFFAQAFTFIWSLITNFLYFICKFILNLLDFLFVIVQELAGQNTGSILNSPTIGDASTKDILLRFLFSPTTISVLKALFILSIVLLIIFTIIALIKTEYSSVVNDADNSKMPVFRNVLKSLFLMLFVPIIAIGGIIVSNSVLSSIARAMNATDNTSISTQVFMASAYQSNRFRSYANNNKKIPILFNFRELDEGDNIVETPGGDTVKELEANMKRFLESSTAYDLGAQTFNMFSSGGFFNMSDISADSLYYNLYDNKNDIELTTYRDEYFVMADVVDFVMRTGMQLYIVNAERVLINSGNNAFNISYEGKNIEYKWNN